MQIVSDALASAENLNEILAILRRSTRAISVRHARRDHIVPLLLGLAVKKADYNHGHVVTSNPTGLRIRSKTVVHHVLANLREVLLSSNSSADELDDSLRRLAIPNSY